MVRFAANGDGFRMLQIRRCKVQWGCRCSMLQYGAVGICGHGRSRSASLVHRGLWTRRGCSPVWCPDGWYRDRDNTWLSSVAKLLMFRSCKMSPWISNSCNMSDVFQRDCNMSWQTASSHLMAWDSCRMRLATCIGTQILLLLWGKLAEHFLHN